jgi:PAS domain S-box-containing protein
MEEWARSGWGRELLSEIVDVPSEAGDRFFKELADFAPVMIWRSGTDAMCNWFNKPWLDFVGRPMEREVGNGWAENVHPDDFERCLEVYKSSFDARRPFTMTYRLKRHDGVFRELLDNGAAFYRDGEFAGYFGSCVDVTDFKAMEEQLWQTQKMEAVGQLTGGVAHDFNNLLTIIRSSVDFLQRPDLRKDHRQRYIAAISDTVDRASKLTNQLLAFARRQPLKPEVFDVGQKVAGVAELVRTLVGGRISVGVSGPSSECYVAADVAQFETSLVNLAVNARDAMDGEGPLAIKVERVGAIPSMRGVLSRPGDYVAVSIQDGGVGVAPDKLEAIFEPFFTTKEVGKGTGLGLSQVIGFAKQSNGEVGVESVLGRGSIFTLYLPGVEAGDRTSTPSSHAPATLRNSGQGACVLVVEDNDAVGQFSTDMLHDLGYRTEWASNAAEALDLLGKDAAGFDLVFSDVVMPGMNGVDFARVVREQFADLPVILTSGYSEVLAREEHSGFVLIQKPYSVEALSRTLQIVLSGRPPAVQPGGR